MYVRMFALLGVLGCGKSDTPRPPAIGSAKPAAGATAKPGELAIKIAPPSGMTSDIAGVGDVAGNNRYPLDATGHTIVEITGPKGTVVEAQTAKVTLDDKPARISLDVFAQRLRTPLAAKTIAIPIAATPPGGARVEATFETEWRDKSELLDARKGAIAFPGDDTAKHLKDSLAVVSTNPLYYEKTRGLANPRLFDVDLVAMRTQVNRTKACPTLYGKSGATLKIEMTAIDISYVVYDRRTGKEIAKKAFTPEMKPCPTTEYSTGGKDERASMIDTKLEEEFLDSLIVAAPAGDREVDPPAPTNPAAGSNAPAPVQFATDPGTGFPTLENIKARITREGFKLLGEPMVTNPLWPRSVSVSIQKVDDPEGATASLEIYDFGGADKQNAPTVMHVDDARAIWATTVSAQSAPLVKKIGAKLASFHGARGKDLDAFLKANGLPPDEAAYDEPPLETSVTDYSGYAANHVGNVLLKLRTWAHIKNLVVARDGERVLLLNDGTTPKAKLEAWAKTLAK